MESLPTFGAAHPEMWARLRDRRWLWHSTSLDALKFILSDGAIRPNTGQLPDTFRESKNSYARHLGAVSLFDFATEDEADIFYNEVTWRSVLFGPRGAAVLIRVRSSALDATTLMLPPVLRAGIDPRFSTLPDDVRRWRGWMPDVEALHIGLIAAHAFDGFFLIGEGAPGTCLWHEATNHTDPVPELLEVSARWKAEREKAMAEQSADDGHLGLSGLIEFVRRHREGGV